MNKLFLFVGLLLTLASCGGKLGDNQFLVKGTIENSVGKTLFLSEYTETGPLTVDSVVLKENGEFKLTGNTSYPKFYMLRIGPNEYFTVLLDSAKVLSVEADAKDFVNSYKVTGSDDMDLINQLNERLTVTHTKIDSLGQIYQANEGQDGFDAIKGEIDAAFEKIVEEQRNYSKKFVDENTGSFASMLALSQQIVPQVPVFNISGDFGYFEKVDSALFRLYPQSEDVLKLHDFIVRMKSQTSANVKVGNYGVGDVVPDISLESPEGKVVNLYSLRGKYVLLDFWAGWCRPCRAENPNLVENFNKFKDKGFTIFQVSLDKEKDFWMEAIEKDGLSNWNHVSDLKFWQSEAARAYNISSIPANFLLDPEGKVLAVNLRGPALGMKLAQVLN